MTTTITNISGHEVDIPELGLFIGIGSTFTLTDDQGDVAEQLLGRPEFEANVAGPGVDNPVVDADGIVIDETTTGSTTPATVHNAPADAAANYAPTDVDEPDDTAPDPDAATLATAPGPAAPATNPAPAATPASSPTPAATSGITDLN